MPTFWLRETRSDKTSSEKYARDKTSSKICARTRQAPSAATLLQQCLVARGLGRVCGVATYCEISPRILFALTTFLLQLQFSFQLVLLEAVSVGVLVETRVHWDRPEGEPPGVTQTQCRQKTSRIRGRMGTASTRHGRIVLVWPSKAALVLQGLSKSEPALD